MPEYYWKIHKTDSQYLLGELQYKEIYSARLRENTMAPFHNVSLFRGNDKTYHFVVKDAALNYVDVTGSTAEMEIKVNSDDEEPILLLKTTDPIHGRIDAGNYGDIYFFVHPDDTKNLKIRQYLFKVNVTLRNGKIYTIAQGVINLI